MNKKTIKSISVLVAFSTAALAQAQVIGATYYRVISGRDFTCQYKDRSGSVSGNYLIDHGNNDTVKGRLSLNGGPAASIVVNDRPSSAPGLEINSVLLDGNGKINYAKLIVYGDFNQLVDNNARVGNAPLVDQSTYAPGILQIEGQVDQRLDCSVQILENYKVFSDGFRGAGFYSYQPAVTYFEGANGQVISLEYSSVGGTHYLNVYTPSDISTNLPARTFENSLIPYRADQDKFRREHKTRLITAVSKGLQRRSNRTYTEGLNFVCRQDFAVLSSGRRITDLIFSISLNADLSDIANIRFQRLVGDTVRDYRWDREGGFRTVTLKAAGVADVTLDMTPILQSLINQRSGLPAINGIHFNYSNCSVDGAPVAN